LITEIIRSLPTGI